MSENTSVDLLATLAELTAQLEELKTKGAKVQKNHVAGKPAAGRKYVLLAKEMKMFGKVPRQQAELAHILATNLEVLKEYSEDEVFNLVTTKAPGYPSIARSVQDPTYLFKYYRNLKNDGKHAGFVARNFLRVIG
jgi:hypothetical protein